LKNVDNEVLKYLAEGLTNHTNLTSLKLGLLKPYLINGDGLASFAPALGNLTSLNVFELSFTKQTMKNGFTPFIGALSKLID